MEVGDVVQLKSGGPRMTVEYIEKNRVSCVWIQGGEVKRDEFPKDALEARKPSHPSERARVIS